ncbi:MAG: mono/diheme cytochrome c family protein, partial [Planctomycetota bacterium]
MRPTQDRRSMLTLAIASLLAQGPAPEPTWSNGMGGLVYDNCTECHRPGQAGPFPLLTYADARRRAPMLAEVVEDELMPPWHPVEGHGNFKANRRMSAADKALFIAWADAGAPEGDPKAAPTAP